MLDRLAQRRAENSAQRRAFESEKLAVAIAFAIAAGYAAMLGAGYAQHLWILDKAGHPVVNDFVVFWTAGRMALKGSALATYNWQQEHAAELATIGHPFRQLLGWYYPPLFLAVVALPATLPYVWAFMVWGFSTLVLHATAVARIAGRYTAFAIACAVPWVPVELILGQNGFLTSAIIGLALLDLEKRPALSGLLLGFLSFKPQFGILLPLALAAGGYRRAFAWAAIGTLLWNGIAAAIFGAESYVAFLTAMSTAASNHLVHSDLGWTKLQSVYGFARVLGAASTLAWSMQIAASASAALAVVLCWRSRDVPFELKAALLASATLIATPYVLYYDVPLLGVAGAFLFRQRAFDRFELVLLAITLPFLCTPMLPALVTVPGGLSACLIVLAIVGRRLLAIPRVAVHVASAGSYGKA